MKSAVGSSLVEETTENIAYAIEHEAEQASVTSSTHTTSGAGSMVRSPAVAGGAQAIMLRGNLEGAADPVSSKDPGPGRRALNSSTGSPRRVTAAVSDSSGSRFAEAVDTSSSAGYALNERRLVGSNGTQDEQRRLRVYKRVLTLGRKGGEGVRGSGMPLARRQRP